MFEIRSYSKQELAMLYFPHHTPRAAVQNLMSWVRRNEELTEALHAAHLSRCAKMLSPKQVRLIVEYLDEP